MKGGWSFCVSWGKVQTGVEPGNGKKTLFGVNKTGDYFCYSTGFCVAAQRYENDETYKAHKETSLGKVCSVMYGNIKDLAGLPNGGPVFFNHY